MTHSNIRRELTLVRSEAARGTLRLLVPGTTEEWFCGGLVTILRLAEVLGEVRRTEVVTCRQREHGRPFLDDLLTEPGLGDDIFVVAWGPDVGELLHQLHGRRVCYWSHSFGWGHRPPPEVPILAVSRFTLGLWGEEAPGSALHYLPNPLSDEFRDRGTQRDIDVLHLGRKSSDYVRDALLPALARVCNVVEVTTFVDDLAAVFNRAKVYLYDSRDFWVGQGVSEGFGLQPLEAMACGCTVFTSVNAGLSDFVDPGVTAEKVGVHSVDNDVARVLDRLTDPIRIDPEWLASYRAEAIRARWMVLEPELHLHFDRTLQSPSDIRHLELRSGRRYEPSRPGFAQSGRRSAKRIADQLTSRWRSRARR